MQQFDHGDLSSLDQALAFRIYRVARLLRNDLASFLTVNGFTGGPEQYFIVFRLWEHGSLSQTELADTALNDRANITRHIQALERLGYVKREDAPDDARKKMVTLTVRGRKAVEALQPKVVEHRVALFDNLSAGEIDKLLGTLKKIETRLG